MERESFENPEIAAAMNAHFVCIKVDREERPDLDQIYQSVCQMVTRSGGWPLSVFLTPEQKPFYVGTYYPPSERYGRPGFKQLVLALSRAYAEKRGEVAKVSASWTEAIVRSEATEATDGDIPGREVLAEAARDMAARIDEDNGGFGGAPKFPNSFSLEVMLRQWKQTNDSRLLDLVTLTLRKMAAGGIYDQLAGGFHRYSVDAHWSVPHFEKMLYDNAALPPLYLAAWQATGDPQFRQVVTETLSYVLREMTHPDGGFYSTTDADSEGEEGKFFVFDRAEVFEAVGPDLGELMCRHFGVTMEGNFEHTGKTVLHMAEPAAAMATLVGASPDAVQARLAAGRQRMLAYRARRIPPFRDEKILTAWNGLMISALARAGRCLRKADYTVGAKRAADFILAHLTDPQGGLLRRYKDGNAAIPGYIEDYAYFTAALLDLYEATFEEQYLVAAERYARDTIRLFFDGAGSFFLTQAGGETLIHRPKDAMDSATPAGSSIAVMNLLRLIPFTGDESFRNVAEAVFRTSASHMERYPGGVATLLQALDLYLTSPTEITLVGAPPEAWLERLGALYQPNLVLTRTDVANDQVPVWAGKVAVDGRPTAYVCRDFACSPPGTEWDEIVQHLTR